MITTRFYYTFREVFNVDTDEPTYALEQDLGLYELIKSNLNNSAKLSDDNEYTKTLLQKYVWVEMCDQVITYKDVQHELNEKVFKPTLTDSERTSVIKDIWSILEITRPYYEKMISLLNEQESHLMDKLSNETFNRYNDTPQEGEIGFDDDGYASNTSKTTSKSDIGTVISRLEEIRKLYRNYYYHWCNEFYKIVIWRGEPIHECL